MSDVRAMVERSTTTCTDARRPWLVALGIGLIALSIVAWVDAVAVTVASAVVIGGTLAAGGVFHIVHSWLPVIGAARRLACAVSFFRPLIASITRFIFTVGYQQLPDGGKSY